LNIHLALGCSIESCSRYLAVVEAYCLLQGSHRSLRSNAPIHVDYRLLGPLLCHRDHSYDFPCHLYCPSLRTHFVPLLLGQMQGDIEKRLAVAEEVEEK